MEFRYWFFVAAITGLSFLISGGMILYLQTDSAITGELIGFWVSATLASVISAGLIGALVKKFCGRRWLAITCCACVPVLAYMLTAPIFASIQHFILDSLPSSFDDDVLGYLGIGAAVYVLAGLIFTGWIAIPGSALVGWLASRPSKSALETARHNNN